MDMNTTINAPAQKSPPSEPPTRSLYATQLITLAVGLFSKTADKTQLVRELGERAADFYSASDVRLALECLDDMAGIESELYNKHGYSFKDIHDLPTCQGKSPLMPVRSIEENDLYTDPSNLPEEIKKIMEDTCFYDFFTKNAENIFFVKDKAGLNNIFFNKTVAGRIEPKTKTIFISSEGIDKRSPFEVAAVLIHEAFHIKTYPDYMFTFQGEYAAARFEIEYWQKVLQLPGLTPQDRELAQKRITVISAFLKTTSYN